MGRYLEQLNAKSKYKKIAISIIVRKYIVFKVIKGKIYLDDKSKGVISIKYKQPQTPHLRYLICEWFGLFIILILLQVQFLGKLEKVDQI